MDTINYSFYEIDSDPSFEKLALALHSKCMNGLIRVFSPEGSGSVRKLKFEDGFHMRAWDLQPSNTVIFNKTTAPHDTEKIFHIAYLLNPTSLSIKSINVGRAFTIQEGMNVIFVSSNTELSFEVGPGDYLKAIDISFNASWLMNAYKEADKEDRDFIARLIESDQPTVYVDACSFAEYKNLSSIHEKTMTDHHGLLPLKAGALSLLSDFFNRMFMQMPQDMLGSKIFHYYKMLEVEKILQVHLEKRLPSLESIAHEMALSVSTLKRHFKLMYGKSVYEYYLSLKMDLAKRMLQEKPLTINEVAAILDYEKVSSFIDMFKKHHGFSPGIIRKNGILRSG